MATYSFQAARELVVREMLTHRQPETETVRLAEAGDRVLAEAARADRDYPPADRSIRDGFAVRAEDLPASLRVIGEVRAGGVFAGRVGQGQCVEIMTGAPMPEGADAVVMVEHTSRDGETMTTARTPQAGEFVNRRGSEARAGDVVVPMGELLTFSRIAQLATCGITQVRVYRKPRVAVLSTGDEVIPIESKPEANQVRNSNGWALARQIQAAGGTPTILPVAPDEMEASERLISLGLEHDLLLLSGGVSAGKYDYVEPALATFGAEFLFDRVLIQPGQPLVFGFAHQGGRRVPFFGLPGNPASTMVCFQIFARAAVQLLAGRAEAPLPMPLLRLTQPFRHKTGLTRFLPARVNEGATEITPIAWQGSSDVPALARANAFLVADSERAEYAAGDSIGAILLEG